jgi:hypothetical protein
MKQVSGSKAGGGIGSKVVRHSSNPKTEPRPRAANPGGAAQLGTALGTHVSANGGREVKGAAQPLYAGKGYSTPVGPTKSVAGPGGGRDVHRSGSQCMHGSNPGEKPGQARQIIEAAGAPRVTK